MAETIYGHLYRVGLDSEYNYSYISADSLEDLIRYLVDEYTGLRNIVGVKEIRKDGSLHTVPVTSTALFQKLTEEKLRKEPYLPVEIDGQLWATMLPTGGAGDDNRYNIWDQVTRAAAKRNDLFHYHTILTICQDHMQQDKTCCIGRGYSAVHYRNTIPTSLRQAIHGYRPVLIPLDRNTRQPDYQRLAHIRDGTIVVMGMLYMNEKPLHNPKNPVLDGDIPRYIPSSKLHIGDTQKDIDFQIKWIKAGNHLISDRNLVRELSWNDLDSQGLVYGKGKAKEQLLPIEVQVEKAQQKNQKQGRGDAQLPSLSTPYI